MKKIKYIKVGDYYLPNIKLKEEKITEPLGRYGRMYLEYLKENERVRYNSLLLENKLFEYLHEIDKQAYELHDRLVKQYKEKWGVTEELKQQDQMEWVRLMNNIEHCVSEIVDNNFLYKTN